VQIDWERVASYAEVIQVNLTALLTTTQIISSGLLKIRLAPRPFPRNDSEQTVPTHGDEPNCTVQTKTALFYPVYFEWTDAVNLDNVPLRYTKMVHAFRQNDVGPCGHVLASIFVELITGPHAEDS
jgi:hypothetical protein